ncbi:MAG TPA: twitch domain-containing radical SAM protein [Bacteroidales bacterium]|nr:twitch domain-containing radical SAM protein [Bacteroidales bacterium]
MSNFHRFFKPDQIKKRPEDTICVLPWVHLNIRPNGKVLQCCMTLDHKNYAGDLNKQTIEEVWNGRFLRTMRKKMLKGIEPEMCRRCFDDERVCGSSIRTLQNGHFADKFKKIPQITRPDGSLEKVELKYWDFRFSNRCNFKCRTCSFESSSGWLYDAKKLGWISEDTLEQPVNIKSVNRINYLDFVRKNLSTVEQIYFAGGEPLLMDEHWQILDLLDEHKRYDVLLTYSTNLSVLKYKNKNALDYWTKWGDRVTLLPSIDATGRRAELIRSGTKWSTIEANLKAVNQVGVFIMPNISVSAMNIFTITDLIDYLTETGIINHADKWWQNFNFNVITIPEIFHVSILPDEVRKDIRNKMDTYIDHYEQKYGVGLRQQFTSLFSHLETPWNKKNARLFKDFTESLDRIRDENTLEVIPELVCVLEG